MKEKLFKKGIKRRLFSVVLAMAVVVGLVPLNSSTVYADAEWKTYQKEGLTIWYDSSIVVPDFGEGGIVMFDCFTCDPPGGFQWIEDEGWEEQNPCDHIRTTNPHTHGSWDYTASGTTLTAECKATTGTCDLDDGNGAHKVSLTLTATSPNYSGNPLTFGDPDPTVNPSTPDIKITNYKAWSDEMGKDPSVEFSSDGGQTWKDGHVDGNRPQAIGDYKIRIYPYGVNPDNTNTITKDFSIEFPVKVTKKDGSKGALGTDYEVNTNDKSVTLLTNDLIVSGGSSNELLDYKIYFSGSDPDKANSIVLKNLYLGGEKRTYIEANNGVPILKIEGTNQIGSSDKRALRGIQFYTRLEDFTVTGSGKLTIYDREDGIYSSSNNSGLVFDSNFTGTLTIDDLGDSPNCAINIDSTLTVNSGTLDLKSERANGITAYSVEIKGGTVIARGGDKAMSVAPILGTGIKVEAASNEMDGTPTVEYKEENIEDYKYLKINKPSSNHSTGGYRPGGTTSSSNNNTGTIGTGTGGGTNITVDTNNGNATVSDIPANTINNQASTPATGENTNTSLVIDVSGNGKDGKEVTKVTLTKSTVENISKALDANTNNKTNLVVKTGNAEVTFDAASVRAIAEQASAGNIQIVVENTTGANLNNSQKKVVEDLGKGNGEKQVVQNFEASIISGGRKISNFMGGNVTVAQIHFTVPAGKKASNYHIYYIPTSGAAERLNTWVKDGRIYFVTGHFSDYVIVYDETVSNGRGIPVYRLYHGQLGDHLFTTSAAERNAAQKIGYKLEGVGFYASGTGNKVYRLYNGNSGEHFYTASEKERDLCQRNGWTFEGVAFITEGEKKVYRLYNGKVHFFTSSEKEKNFCLAQGWKLEGVRFKAN